MRAEAGSPISTYFGVCDRVRVRFADTRADSDPTVVLVAPWPESLWAFGRIWDRVVTVGRVVAIDLPGLGHSDGRPELIAPDTSGAFLAGLIDQWGLAAPSTRCRSLRVGASSRGLRPPGRRLGQRRVPARRPRTVTSLSGRLGKRAGEGSQGVSGCWR